MEHAVPGRSPDERQQLVGVPDDSRGRPAVQPRRQPVGDVEHDSGRDRRRSDLRRHLHQRPREQQGQHRAHRADLRVGLPGQPLLARQRRVRQHRQPGDLPAPVEPPELPGQPAQRLRRPGRLQLAVREHVLVVRAGHGRRPRLQVRGHVPPFGAAGVQRGQPERHVLVQHRPRLRSGRPLHLSRAAQRAGRQPPREALPVPGVHDRAVLPGQVAGQRPADHRPRHALRPGGLPGLPPRRAGRTARQPDGAQRAGPDRQEQLVAAHLHRLRSAGRRAVGAAGGVRHLLRQDPDRHPRQLHAEPAVHGLVHGELPVDERRPGTRERDAPDQPVPAELRPRRERRARLSRQSHRTVSLRGSGRAQHAVPGRLAAAEHRHRLPRLRHAQAAVSAPDDLRLRARAGPDALGVGRLRPHDGARHARPHQLQHADPAGHSAQRPPDLLRRLRPAGG